MTTSRSSFVLNTGDFMPAVGLGTWQSKPGEVENAVAWALASGYRHIDTAFAYGNEKEVGLGIKASGVSRDKIWLTTKLDNQWHTRVPEAIETSLANLGTEYVDLFLMHWPVSLCPDDDSKVVDGWDYTDTWCEMQKLVATGRVCNIGVSNFGILQLERLLKDERCTIVPAVNQVELHPFNPSFKLLEYHASKGIHATAYSPLGSTNSPIYRNKALVDIAKAHGRTVQQVLLMWGLQRGVSVLPKSVNKARIEANNQLQGWQLSHEEMKALSSIEDRFKVAGDSWLPVRVFLDVDEPKAGSELVSKI